STGPPRERGGKLLGVLRTASAGYQLQRGHRANAVERAIGTVIRCKLGPLQRGHRANAVEREGRPRVRERGQRASTGPPRERGGKSGNFGTKSQQQSGFNGATARTRWKDEMTQPSAGNFCASTGPPRERGGK